MTVTLKLSPEHETRLRQKAAQDGQDITTYLQSLVEREAQDATEEMQGTAYDLFEGKIGGIHSGGQGQWSENTGEKFAAGMEAKRNQGHL